MYKFKNTLLVIIFLIYSLICIGNTAYAAGDTCMFEVTADEMPPKIVVLLDNGAMMKHQTPWQPRTTST